MITTDATVNDTEVTATVHGDLAERSLTPAEHDVDGGYVTAAHILSARDEHGIDLVGPVGVDTYQTRYGQEFLSQRAFTIDWEKRQVMCPQGAVSAVWSDWRKDTGTLLSKVHFAAADCVACPLKARCTTAQNGKWGRSLTLLPRAQQEVLDQRRAEQHTEAWKVRYGSRAGIEGTISQAVRITRTRTTPYCGLTKTSLGHVLTAVGLNFHRLDAWWTGTPIGTTRTSHFARLGFSLAA